MFGLCRGWEAPVLDDGASMHPLHLGRSAVSGSEGSHRYFQKRGLSDLQCTGYRTWGFSSKVPGLPAARLSHMQDCEISGVCAYARTLWGGQVAVGSLAWHFGIVSCRNAAPYSGVARWSWASIWVRKFICCTIDRTGSEVIRVLISNPGAEDACFAMGTLSIPCFGSCFFGHRIRDCGLAYLVCLCVLHRQHAWSCCHG